MKNLVNNAYNRAVYFNVIILKQSCLAIMCSMAQANVRYPRYPAPGSEPIDHAFNESDYKTAYRDSIHHIRYLDFEQDHEARYVFQDPISENETQKLVRLKYLSQGDLENQDAINLATKAYEKNNGEPLMNKIHLNEIQDEAWDTMVKNKFSRESMAYFVRDQFQSTNQVNAMYPIENDFHDLYHPEVLEIVHIDMISHDPVFRQLIVDQTWLLNRITESRRDRGSQRVFKGDPNFWHAIDNSFSSENIKRVQSSIGDNISNLESTAIDTVHNKVDYHKEEEVPFPIRSKFVK